MVAVKTPAPERAAGRKRLAKAGKSLADGSFPIPTVPYLHKALRAVGRAAPGKRPKLAKLIRKRARELGATSEIKGSWADNTQSAKAMANALGTQFRELGYTPQQIAVELNQTMTFMLLELAGAKKAKTWDPDNDGDDDSSPSGDTDNDYAGKLNPKQQAVMKKLIAKGWDAKRAYKFACNLGSGKMGKASAA